MCYTFIYILLISTLLVYVHTQKCENTQYKVSQTPVNSGCYTPLSGEKRTADCTYTCEDKPNVNITVDDVKGTLIARFPLPPFDCGHTMYRVNLMVNEQVREESNCNENATFTDKHSIREYKIHRLENGNGVGHCNKYGEVIFNYIFPSCYKLWIEALINTSSRPALHSCPFFITTNFTKIKIADIQPVMQVNYNSEENNCTVDVMYHQAISKTAIELIFSENGSRVNWAEVSVKAGIGSNGPPVCITSLKVTEPTCFANNLFKKIQCYFFNIYPGNYCVRIKLTDDRCVPGTIWTANNTSCRWSYPFVAESHPPNKPDISIPLDSTLTAFLILLGLAVGGLLILLLFWRNVPTSTSWSHAESTEEVGRPMIEGLKVLLLYPRDCQDFMNTMESFRKLLENYNIEVYDCYASDEVLNGPLYWLQKVMAYPKLCTVIVSSHCAYLQQQALQMGCNVTSDSVYKDPVFLDSIFMYGLRIIMEDISVDTYLKKFVIGFGGFSSDEKMLSLPTNFRRYYIPEHLPKLLVDMNLEVSLENSQICSSNEYIELQNNVKSLINYVKINPQYLEDTLNLV